MKFLCFLRKPNQPNPTTIIGEKWYDSDDHEIGEYQRDEIGSKRGEISIREEVQGGGSPLTSLRSWYIRVTYDEVGPRHRRCIHRM